MKKRYILLIFIILLFGLILKSFWGSEYTVKINQKIGGKLICDVIESSDIQSWMYQINYSYLDSQNNLYKIGKGLYEGEEWDKNVQLIQYQKWIILKTGNSFDSQKIFIGDVLINEWKEYIFSPRNIQSNAMWRSRDIHSLFNYSPSEVKIKKIENGNIFVTYTYRVDKKNTYKFGKCIIQYHINKDNGDIKMVTISEVNQKHNKTE